MVRQGQDGRRIGRGVTALFLVVSLGLGGCTQIAGGVRLDDLEPPSREIEITAQGKLAQLSNGVRLFVVPDPVAGLLEFDVRHHVGARDDPPGREGLAHYVEHLMFQVDGGSGARIFDEVRDKALLANAYTHADYTHYMTQARPRDLEWLTRHAGARLQFDCNAISDETLTRELEVVRNEMRGRVWFTAYSRGVFGSLFPKGHPYRTIHEVSDETLASLTREDVCTFVENHYVPQRTDIVVTGNVDPQAVLELARVHVASVPARTVPPRAQVPALVASTRPGKTDVPGETPLGIVAYPMPARSELNATAARVLRWWARRVLANNVGGEKSAVRSWSLSSQSLAESPLAVFTVEPKSKAQLQAAIDEVRDALGGGFASGNRGQQGAISFDIMRQGVRRDALAEFASVGSSAAAYADALGGSGDKPRLLGDQLYELDSLSLTDARTLAGTLFSPKRARVLLGKPTGSIREERAEGGDRPLEDRVLTEFDIDPAEAHRALEVDVASLMTVVSLEFVLDNGLKVIAVQSTRFPLLDMKLVVGAGTMDTPQQHDIAWLAAYGYLLDRSVLDAVGRWNRLVATGGQIEVEVGTRTTTFSIEGLSIYLDLIVAGFSENTINAIWAPGVLKAWRETFDQIVESEGWQGAAHNDNVVREALYGPGHPHAMRVPETEEDLRNIGTGDVTRFRRSHYRAGNATLIVTGGFDLTVMQRYVEGYFGPRNMRARAIKWQQEEVPKVPIRVPEPKPGSIRLFTQEMPAVQTSIEQSYPLAETFGTERAGLLVLVEMANTELRRLRENLGVSYGVYAELDDEQPRVVVGGRLDSRRLAESLPAVREAVAAVWSSDDFDRRFAHARRVVLERLVAQLGDPQQLSEGLADAVRAGQSYEALPRLVNAVAGLRSPAVRTLGQRRLDADASVTVIRGSKASLAVVSRLRGFGGATELAPLEESDD